jgi:hypothetical protein
MASEEEREESKRVWRSFLADAYRRVSETVEVRGWRSDHLGSSWWTVSPECWRDVCCRYELERYIDTMRRPARLLGIELRVELEQREPLLLHVPDPPKP